MSVRVWHRVILFHKISTLLFASASHTKRHETHLGNLVILSQLLVRTPQPRVDFVGKLLGAPWQVVGIEEIGKQANGRFRADIDRFQQGKDIGGEKLYVNKRPHAQFTSQECRGPLGQDGVIGNLAWGRVGDKLCDWVGADVLGVPVSWTSGYGQATGKRGTDLDEEFMLVDLSPPLHLNIQLVHLFLYTLTTGFGPSYTGGAGL